MNANQHCPHSEEVAAFVGGELPLGERIAFAAHLEECPACRSAVASTEKLLARLNTVPRRQVTRDLAAGVLARIEGKPALQSWNGAWPRLATAAAVFLLIGASAYWYGSPVRRPAETAADSPQQAIPNRLAQTDSTVDRALDWFCRNQEADGSWSAERWGGNPRFQVALTALPTLALLSAEATPARESAIRRAIERLRQDQASNGAFGASFHGTPYNHGIATLTLLHAYRKQPEPGLKRALDAALAVVARQAAILDAPEQNQAITLWHVEALELAVASGWDNAKPSLDRARLWMASRNPSPNPVDLAEKAAPPEESMDYYQAYFLSATMRKDSDGASRRKLAVIRRTLVAQQVSNGTESGTWEPDQRWGKVGGRLYTTAMASLVLR